MPVPPLTAPPSISHRSDPAGHCGHIAATTEGLAAMAPSTPAADPARIRTDRRVINRGDRVELVSLTEDYRRFGLSAGECGTVAFTDSLRTVHIRWDSGRRAGIRTTHAHLLRNIGHTHAYGLPA